MAIEIVDFPMKNGDFPWFFVYSPEGYQLLTMVSSSMDLIGSLHDQRTFSTSPPARTAWSAVQFRLIGRWSAVLSGASLRCQLWTDLHKASDGFGSLTHGSLNVPIEHHPTIRYMVYNGYYKVMSNIPKMGHLPTPVTGNIKMEFSMTVRMVWKSLFPTQRSINIGSIPMEFSMTVFVVFKFLIGLWVSLLGVLDICYGRWFT